MAVEDRPDEALAEAIDERAAGGSAREVGSQQLLLSEALLPEVLHEQVPSIRRESTREVDSRLLAESSLCKETTRRRRSAGRRQLRHVELDRCAVRRHQPLPLARLALSPGGAVALLVAQLDADAVG